MRTRHMQDRMQQRGFTEAEIGLIEALGEWNPRTDRIVLTKKMIEARERQLRSEIADIERRSSQ